MFSKDRNRIVSVIARAIAVTSLGSSALPQLAAAATWYRGIIHAHANWGVSKLPTTSPDVVVRWHRQHNYNFVSITDLNDYPPPDGLKALLDAPDRFLVGQG